MRKRRLQNPARAVRLSAFSKDNKVESSQTALRKARHCRQTIYRWRKREVPTGTCPECDADVHVDTDADKGDVVSCEECGTDLEVVGLDPVELDIVEEDNIDDDDEEEEF